MTEDAVPASGNALERVRRRNLARVLALVHERGPSARSALTRATGLNRSTIGVLVAELVELGLALEGQPAAASGVGRPSPTVRADGSVVAVAVNPEIDAVTVALVGLDGTEHRRVRRALDHVPSADEAVAVVVDVLAGLGDDLAGARVVGIGVAVPGIVRAADGLVRVAPHLGWHEQPFAARLADATGLRVSAANDANLGVRAEQRFGSARGHDDVVYVNGGASGIGSGIIVDGRVLAGRSGYAGELGHTLVEPDGVRCHCGSRGCLETVVSQASLLAAAGLRGPGGADGSGGPDGSAGARGPEGSGDLPAGDRLAAALVEPTTALAAEVDRQLASLAVALRNVIATVNPDLVVLGGFLGVLHDHAGDRLEALVTAQTMPMLAEGVAITTTSLGSAILLRGAADLAFEPLLADPVGTLEALRRGPDRSTAPRGSGPT